jgi:hypothetical protein
MEKAQKKTLKISDKTSLISRLFATNRAIARKYAKHELFKQHADNHGIRLFLSLSLKIILFKGLRSVLIHHAIKV